MVLSTETTSRPNKPTAAFVWGIADLLRGPYKPNEYGSVILPFTILRRLECILEPHRETIASILDDTEDDGARRSRVRRRTGLRFYNSSPYTLRRALQDPDNLAANLVNYTKGFSADIDVFERFSFETQVARLDETSRLALVADRFSGLDLHPDIVPNAEMGDLFENLIYRFAEASNEQAGDFYTPRDAIRLLVDILFAEDSDALRKPGVVRSVYDPAAGTGGMLSVAQEHLLAQNPDAELSLYGQELNPHSYAICKSDLLIKDQDPTNVRLGDTLARDLHAGRTFDYCLSNPPYGVDWKASEAAVREEAKRGFDGRFGAGLPSVSDGAMLFLSHLASKIRPVKDGGGRAGIVLSGSPLFNGGADSGPSNIRRHLLENDLVEAIVALPTDMFYNTGISTYLWVLDNTKQPERRGRVQLIDASGRGTKMRKGLGSKRVEIADAGRDAIVREYAAFEESDTSKIFDNADFAYWAVTVERPLRLAFQITPERIDEVLAAKPLAKEDHDALRKVLLDVGDDVYLNREKFLAAVRKSLVAAGRKLGAPQFKAIWAGVGTRDEEADICRDRKGNPEPDTSLRDTELVPFGWGGNPKPDSWDDTRIRDKTIEEYFAAEVTPHVPDAWVGFDKTKVGCEIPFTRHFYKYLPPRPLAEIDAELNAQVAKIMSLLREVEQ